MQTENIMLQAPGGPVMGGALPANGVTLRQTTDECCRCCCCQPNIDWGIHPYATQSDLSAGRLGPKLMDVKENASYCGRCWSFCSPGHRATEYTVTDASGNLVMTHAKPRTCGTNVFITFVQGGGQCRLPCCCFLPYLETTDPTGRLMGSTVYECDLCLFVPKFLLQDGAGNPVFRIRSDTCCFGCCIKCVCCDEQNSGTKCCRVPYFIRDPNTNNKLPNNPAIWDLWLGLEQEACRRRNIYGIEFPPGLPDDIKATLIGTALLLDIVVYEQDQN